MPGQVYGSGTGTAPKSTNGVNVRIDALREKGIRAAKKEIIFEQLCSKETMPLQHGKTLKVHKTLYILDDNNKTDQGLDGLGKKPAAGKPNADGNLYGGSRSVVDVSAGMPLLGEGAGRANRVGMTRITREGTLTRMGAFLEYTDEVELFSDQAMEIQYYEKMGELAADLYDDYLQKEMLGAAGMECYGGKATTLLTLTGKDGDASVLSYDLIRKVQISLKANHAKKTTSIVTGSTKIGTVPVNASWFAYLGAASTVELEKLKDDFDERAYVPARMYAAAGNLAKGEVGAVHSTRFIEADRMMHYDGAGAKVVTAENKEGFSFTTLDATQATARGQGGAGDYYDGFPVLWVTKGSFATIGLQGNKKIKFLSKKPGAPTQEDPHGLMGLYSFNFFVGSIVLEPEKIARLVHVSRAGGVCPVTTTP